ncbi:hypothetical protein Sango_1919000 [Sesamum angolense]|uniref:DUF4218 domain-containing protein n=1 Tax=Sesamum angolense TaxID=2727404 RepID=A0AAE2BN05_9LAMI|nr:hypothetical protein Sango_1919000 [Sesamum angolense]
MKDNLNAWKDLKIICNRSKLEVDERRPNVMSKAVYTLTKGQKRWICECIIHLKFPDGYTSNLAHCVYMKELRMHGMKSYDCHVFMQKLIPVAFREMLPGPVWSVLTEVKNKAQVELSIVEAYLIEEIDLFTSHYFEPQILCKQNRPRSNDDLMMNENRSQWSIFNHLGQASGTSKKRWLSGSERHIIKMYILCNCGVVMPYYE